MQLLFLCLNLSLSGGKRYGKLKAEQESALDEMNCVSSVA